MTRLRISTRHASRSGAAALLLALLATLTFANGATAAQPQVNLRTADSYGALAAGGAFGVSQGHEPAQEPFMAER